MNKFAKLFEYPEGQILACKVAKCYEGAAPTEFQVELISSVNTLMPKKNRVCRITYMAEESNQPENIKGFFDGLTAETAAMFFPPLETEEE